jgi:hypothetical protein
MFLSLASIHRLVCGVVRRFLGGAEEVKVSRINNLLKIFMQTNFQRKTFFVFQAHYFNLQDVVMLFNKHRDLSTLLFLYSLSMIIAELYKMVILLILFHDMRLSSRRCCYCCTFKSTLFRLKKFTFNPSTCFNDD